MSSKPGSRRTARLSRSVLRAALRHADQHGLVARNVAALAEPVKSEHREKEAMTIEQIRELLDVATATRDDAAVVLLVTLLRAVGSCSACNGPT